VGGVTPDRKVLKIEQEDADEKGGDEDDDASV